MVNIREASQIKADEIVSYVLNKVESGEWQPRHKLPTEKELIRSFSAARNTVRKAMAALEKDGYITRRPGAGTFITEPKIFQPHGDTADAVNLAEISPAEINEVRVLIEPAIAELVVSKATRSDIERAKHCLAKSLEADSIEEYEYWDAELHATLIHAARNTMLTQIYASIHTARKNIEWHELKRRSLNAARRGNYDKDHTLIVESLTKRDPIMLRKALKSHLEHVSHNMLNPTY